jgi:hypothetical protein
MMKQTVAVACLAFLCSCIVSETQIIRTPIGTDYQESISNDWTYSGDVNVREHDGQTAIAVRVTRHRMCSTTEIRRLGQREQTKKKWRGNSSWVAHGLVAASAFAIAGSLLNHYINDAPFAKDYGPAAPSSDRSGIGTTSATGFSLIGGVAGLGLIGGLVLYGDIRSVDRIRDLPDASETSTSEVVACRAEPAHGVRVEIAGTLGATDEQGAFEVTIADDALALANTPIVQLEGRAIDSDEVRSRQQTIIARRKDAVRQAVTQEELRTGRCDAERAEYAQTVPEAAAPILEVLAQAGGTTYELLDSRAVVATPAGTSFVHEATRHGTLHALVVGYSDLAVALRPDGRSEFGMPSELGGVVQAQLFSNRVRVPSTTAQVAAGDQVEVEVVGEGCAVVLLYAAW